MSARWVEYKYLEVIDSAYTSLFEQINDYLFISIPMRCDGSRPKASMSVSEQNYTLSYIILTIYTAASNSDNVSMPIKFKFLIDTYMSS